jgi:hypothetical protein
MNESLEVVCGPDGVMRDIHDRPMVVIFKSRPTRRKKIKPKEESPGKYLAECSFANLTTWYALETNV